MDGSTTYDVRVYRTEVYKGRAVTTHRVRWKVGAKLCKEGFRTAAQADSFRSALLTAARKGETFGGDVGPLRLRVVPGLGHHDDRAFRVCAIQSASARGYGKSGSCSPITTRTGAATSVRRASAGAWLVRVVRENARAYPGRRRLATIWSRYSPKSAGRRPAYSFGRYDFHEAAAHGGVMATRSRTRRIALVLPFADERPDQHQTRDEFRPLRCGECRSAGAHGIADHDCRAAEFLDQGYHVASGLSVAVGGERGIAVAVAAKIGAGDPVTSIPQGRGEEPVAGLQVTHAGHQHRQRPVAGDVIADAPAGTREVAGVPRGRSVRSRHGGRSRGRAAWEVRRAVSYSGQRAHA